MTERNSQDSPESDITDDIIQDGSKGATRAQRSRYWLRQVLPFAAVLLTVFTLLYLLHVISPPPQPLAPSTVEEIAQQVLNAATPPAAHSAEVYEFILPSLVMIRTDAGEPPSDQSARHQAGAARPENRLLTSHSAMQLPVQNRESMNVGTGIVVNADGAILTAYHVVEFARSIDVIYADGTESPATIIAIEPDNDIAVLQTDRLPESFAPATLGSPGAMRVGDEAFVVGNPYGLGGSISAGVISGFDRTYRRSPNEPPLQRLIQFDAAVNPGSAGAPLLNRDGEVIGIVIGPVNPGEDDTFAGIGLAVRIDIAGAAAGAPAQ